MKKLIYIPAALAFVNGLALLLFCLSGALPLNAVSNWLLISVVFNILILGISFHLHRQNDVVRPAKQKSFAFFSIILIFTSWFFIACASLISIFNKVDNMEFEYNSATQFIVQYDILYAGHSEQILDQFDNIQFGNFIEYDGHDRGMGKINLFFYTNDLETTRQYFIRMIQEGAIEEPSAMAVRLDDDYQLIYPEAEREFDLF